MYVSLPWKVLCLRTLISVEKTHNTLPCHVILGATIRLNCSRRKFTTFDGRINKKLFWKSKLQVMNCWKIGTITKARKQESDGHYYLFMPYTVISNIKLPAFGYFSSIFSDLYDSDLYQIVSKYRGYTLFDRYIFSWKYGPKMVTCGKSATFWSNKKGTIPVIHVEINARKFYGLV